ncbi:hypothetical protein [Brevibacterium marinum]|uniref:PQQ-like domain-containing protein n=1 Tax=Brevibacterium marinum TaxID=418643 RepID=A0A846RY42_9MICO|nr:hypothetical protein [Brevibacterium marinum]NJC56355.1 hypothetical protein [Brevibacterium marinum]
MRPRPTASAVLPLALTVIVGLSACSAFGSDSQSFEPNPAGTQAPSFDAGEAKGDSAASRAVDPGWDAPAQEADGTFLSMYENDDSLEYRAVDSTGQVVWTAHRPRACSAYLVTSTDDGPIAVLMDQGSSTGNSLTPTASGYDLATGRKRWGPVETPGALLGNGLVFAGAPKDFIGTSGPRTALDPATGEVAAVEAEDGGESEDSSPRVVALFGEHLIRGQGNDIVGEDPEGHRLWTRATEDFGLSAPEAREVPWEPIGDSHALVGEADSEARTLIDLRSGTTVDSKIAGAWFDSSSNTLVTAGPDLRGYDADGTKRWSTPLPENAEVAAVGAGLIAFDSESGSDSESGHGSDHTEQPEQPVTARSARDGSSAAGGTPLLMTVKRLGAPHHISESGAALIGDPQTPLLTTRQD